MCPDVEMDNLCILKYWKHKEKLTEGHSAPHFNEAFCRIGCSIRVIHIVFDGDVARSAFEF